MVRLSSRQRWRRPSDWGREVMTVLRGKWIRPGDDPRDRLAYRLRMETGSVLIVLD